MADHPILDMFGELAPTEGSVLQEIGVIESADGSAYDSSLGQMQGSSAMMSGLPQTGTRLYGHVAAHPPMQQDRTKIQQINYGDSVDSSGMGMQTQYVTMNSKVACTTDSSGQQQQQQTAQQRYGGVVVGANQYRSQQYPFPSNQQYDGMQYPSGMMQQPQHPRPINAPQQTQQYPNSWSNNSQAQSHGYMQAQQQQRRMPLQPQQHQSFMDYNSPESTEPQTAISRQQMPHYPSNIPTQQHIPQASSLASGQMGMYHQTGYPQSSPQQQQLNNVVSSYGGAQSHPSMPQQQQMSGYPQASQSQRPSSSYYNSGGLGSRPTTPQQQPQPYTNIQGHYSASNNVSSNMQANDGVRLQQIHNSSPGSHNTVPQNGTMGQNAYFPSQNSSSLLSPGQQFRSPAQLSACPSDPLMGSAQLIPNSNPQYRSTVVSPRRPTPPASGSVSPMPLLVRTPERYNAGNHPPQSTTPLSQGFPSPRQMMSPSEQVSPVPTAQQTSLQQLEQMVMPGPKLADKPDVGLYSHHKTPMSSATIRNNTSPSYGMNPAMLHQNVSLPNNDNVAHGMPSMMQTANTQNSFHNNVNSVLRTTSSAPQIPVMHQGQPKPISHTANQLPISSTNNIANVQQNTLLASSLSFDTLPMGASENSSVTDDPNLKLIDKLNTSMPVASMDESQNTEPTFPGRSLTSSSINPVFSQSSVFTSHDTSSEDTDQVLRLLKLPVNEVSNVPLQQAHFASVPSSPYDDVQPIQSSKPNISENSQVCTVVTPSASVSPMCNSPIEIQNAATNFSSNQLTPQYGQPADKSSIQLHSPNNVTNQPPTKLQSQIVPVVTSSPVTLPMPATTTTSQSSTSPQYNVSTSVYPQPVLSQLEPPQMPSAADKQLVTSLNSHVGTQAIGPPQLQIGASPIRPSSQQHFMPTLNHQEPLPNLAAPSQANVPCVPDLPNVTSHGQAKVPGASAPPNIQIPGQANVPCLPASPQNAVSTGPPNMPRLPVPQNIALPGQVSMPMLPGSAQLNLPDRQYRQSTGASCLIPDYMMAPQQKVFDVQQMQNKIQSLCTLPPTPMINQEVSYFLLVHSFYHAYFSKIIQFCFKCFSLMAMFNLSRRLRVM